MKKVIFPVFGMALFFSLALIAAPSTTQPSSLTPSEKAAREKNVPPDLVDQTDDTDVYAVPLDTSVEEEDVQEHRLEQIQKRLEANKPTPQKTSPTTQK